MAIAVVQGPTEGSTVSGGTVAVTTGSNVTAGNGLIISVRAAPSTLTISQVTINGESNATPIGSQLSDSTLNTTQQWFYLQSISSGGATKTATATIGAGSTGGAINIFEISGQATSGSLIDTSKSATGNTGTTATVNLTTTVASDAIFAAVTNDGSGKATAQSGYTSDNTGMANINWFDSMEHNVNIGAANTYTVDMGGLSSGNDWMIYAIAVSPAGTDTLVPQIWM